VLRSPHGATFYDVLGVPRNANDEVIRAAFRKAAKALHPDVNGGDPQAEKRLRHVIAAHQLLRSPQQRVIYDQLLAANEQTLRNLGLARNRRFVAAPTVAALVTASIVTVAVWQSSKPPSTPYMAGGNILGSALQTHGAGGNIGDELPTTAHREAKLLSENGIDDTIDERARQGLVRLSEEAITKEGAEVVSTSSTNTLERRAADFISGQVSGWSSTNAIDVASFANAYADEVLYYGSVKPRQAVLVDKRRLMKRWPERIYQVRPDSIWVQCVANLCKVNGLVDWQVHSTPRAASAKGLARFDYLIIPTNDVFTIFSEGSSVVRPL
jgi:curved DNA-binding protein CbpA